MLTYQRRAKWIRRMQDRAARRREREIYREWSARRWLPDDTGFNRAA